MKNKLSFLYAFLLIVFTFFMFAGIAKGQSAWSNQGLTSNPDVDTKTYQYQLTLNGTDTLYTKSFSNEGFNRIHTLWYYTTQANDSIRVNFVKQAKGITGQWKTIETVGIDSITTVGYWSDSLAIEAVSWRYAIYGSSASGGDKNGHNATVKFKLIFKRE